MAADMRFVWVDLEMTGLDPETCAIVEVAVVLTTVELEPLAQLERVVWQPPEVLARMDPFVRQMHTQSGLLGRIAESKFSLRDVETEALALVSSHCKFGEGILAGNSIHQDRRFLSRYVPAFERYLHYRQVDVSSLKLLARAWYGPHLEFKKEKSHTALADIEGSIAELKFYREHLLR
jgi:oligoribonuclease